MDAIRIGKFIKDTLISYDDVNKVVKGNIFPLVAKEGTPFPFILYTRQGIDPYYTKDKEVNDTVVVSIDAIDNTYEGANKLITAVYDCLQHKVGDHNGFNIRSCRMVDANEAYDDAFIQSMVFNIEIERL